MSAKPSNMILQAVVRTATRVTAYVKSRVLRRDLRTELEELQQLPPSQTYAQIALTMAVLLAIALIAASFGWVGLAFYFVAIIILFY